MEKTRFALWITEDALQLVEDNSRQNNCKKSEFIEQAIRFYCGYLHALNLDNYLPAILAETLEGHLSLLAERIAKLLYKQSVELAMLTHIIAADSDIDEATLQRLRGLCVRDVNSTNGQLSFREILRFQKEAY
jgi:hypothetical protein